jgi:23S rRNA (cytosine1962-C5)-methyltransferase
VSARLVLKPGRQRSVERRHPWVFSGAVARVEGDPQSGESVMVCAAEGTELGWAAYSPSSQIRARMWNHDPSQPITPELLTSLVHVAALRRDVTYRCDTNAVRVVFSEADGVPGLIADRYGDVVVCQFTSAGADLWRDVLMDALATLPGVASVYERSDVDVREREGLPMRTGPARGVEPPAEVTIHEAGVQYAVDVRAGHKTGFYLDQRNARREVAAWAEGRRVLNVCSYSGAFSVIAAQCGAAAVTSIDSSAAAHQAARRNAELNGVDIGELIEGDAFAELRRLRDRALQYDLIVLDPPKLAANDKQLDKASRAYKDLNLSSLKLLAPGGVLLTFSCSGAMSMELFQKVVAGAALDARRDARVIGRLHQPDDHPVPLWFPEAEYLKGLVVRVD